MGEVDATSATAAVKMNGGVGGVYGTKVMLRLPGLMLSRFQSTLLAPEALDFPLVVVGRMVDH